MTIGELKELIKDVPNDFEFEVARVVLGTTIKF